MCLIRRWLRAPLEKDGKLIKRRMGVPQGSPISPLLSNIVLHELDSEMESLGLRFVRYADDFSIYCKTKAEAKKTGNMIYLFLRDKLWLPINRDKSGIRRPINFQILGFSFVPIYRKGVKGKYQLVVAKKRWQSFKSKLKEVTKKTNPMSFGERISKLIEIQRGWINNFKHAHIKIKLEELDGWLRNRLRYCIWSRYLSGEKVGAETKEPDTIGRRGRDGVCLEQKSNGWMGHCPKSYFRNYHHYRPPQKARLCSTCRNVQPNGSETGNFKFIIPHGVENRRIRDPYVRWCERRTGGQLTVSRLLDLPNVIFIPKQGFLKFFRIYKSNKHEQETKSKKNDSSPSCFYSIHFQKYSNNSKC